MTNNVIHVPRVTKTGPSSAVSIWPADDAGIVSAEFHSLATTETRKVRQDLTAEEKARLAKYGSVAFKSAGATRKART